MIRSTLFAVLRSPLRVVPPRVVCLLAAGLLAALPACSSTGPGREPSPTWASANFAMASGTVLWEYAMLAVQKMGFHIGSGLDPANMELETGWKTALVPFRGQGYRQQALITMEPIEAGGWAVAVRVKKQMNMSLVRPTDLRYAEWKWTDDDQVAAHVLLQHIRTYLGPELGRGIEITPDSSTPDS